MLTSYDSPLREVKVPDKFLGSNIKPWKYIDDKGNDKQCWAMGLESYVKEACKVVEGLMAKDDLKYPPARRHGSKTPFATISYRPESDVTDFCDEAKHKIYQNMISILRWVVELVRIYINLEVSSLSQYLA